MSDAQLTPATAGFYEFDLADRMRRTLRVTGIGVQEMADYLEVSRETVGTWINGRVNPRKTALMAWALRTGANYEWLATGCTPPDLNREPTD
jgi:transcriptional regulator with XRE-family HTH domain